MALLCLPSEGQIPVLDKQLGRSGALLPEMAPGEAELFAPRRAGFGENLLVEAQFRIEVERQGLYRITQQALLNAGFGAEQLVGTQLRIFNRENEIALHVSSSRLWTTDDYLIFYGEPFEGSHTAKNVYWLGLGSNGKRMAVQAAAPVAGLATETSYIATKHFRQPSVYTPAFRSWDGSFDHWFSANVNSISDHIVNLATPHRIPGGTATLSIDLSDLLSSFSFHPSRNASVRVNGSAPTLFAFEGHGVAPQEIQLAASSLNPGNNTFTLRGVTSSGIVIAVLDELTLRFPSTLTADNGQLTFAAEQGLHQFQANGFRDATIRCLDITNSNEPRWLSGPSIQTRSATFAAPCDNSVFLLSDETAVIDVQPAFTDFPNLLSPEQQLDYLVITSPELTPQADRLTTYRLNQGLAVKRVLIDDVYNSFSYGIKDPRAIRQFLGYAFHHYAKPALRYAVLIGDASSDPKGYVHSSLQDRVPTLMGPGSFNWTSQDAVLAMVNGEDKRPDIAIGRIPANNLTGLRQVVDKIMSFEGAAPTSAWRKKAQFITDNRDGAGDFTARALEVRQAWFTPNQWASSIASLDSQSPAVVDSLLKSAFANGRSMITYMGHGRGGGWAGVGAGYLFDSSEAAALTNSIYPIVPAFACATGDFENPSEASIVEHLIIQPHGAVACISATSEAFEISSSKIAHGLYESMLSKKTYRLGDALLDGLNQLADYNYSSPELDFYNLFGDPALVVNPSSQASADHDGDGMPDHWEITYGLEPFQADGQNDRDGDGLSDFQEFIHGGDPTKSDSDGDGLDDAWENSIGTNLQLSDSDHDGMNDAFEWQHKLDPNRNDASEDPDNDQLSNYEEFLAGTHPRQSDSDFDGLDDAEELAFGTNPLNPDSDGDGLRDGDEVNRFSTDPTLKDSNGDGLPDGWGIVAHPDGLLNEPVADFDGDGLSNRLEYRAGTDARNNDSDGDGLLDGAEQFTHGTNPLDADSDGDGLADGDEIAHSTDPNNPDSDGDFMPDGWEVANGIHPGIDNAGADPDHDGLSNRHEFLLGTRALHADSDGDGLNDGAEVALGSNPLLSDHDEDGVPDGDEVANGTDPLHPDSDNDGLSDGEEVLAGTLGYSADSDNDGLPDAWEVEFGTQPLVNDRSGDPDADNLNNIGEFLSGSDPHDPDSDHDQLNDGDEVARGTDPASGDSDRDYMNDGSEVLLYGTNPLNPDQDQDGMRDGWELFYQLNPFVNDAAGDADGDTVSNLTEYNNGTNPTKQDSDGDGLRDDFEIANGLFGNLFDRDLDGLSDGDEWLVYHSNPDNADSDGDGLLDGEEVLLHHTNPLLADSDGDGLSDPDELALGSNPALIDHAADPDNDGLVNADELAFETFFDNPDSDGDGLSDGVEVHGTHSDPLLADSDNDGASDGEEFNAGTNILIADSDADGMPDGWELRYHLRPLVKDSLLDPDLDGLPNIIEWQMGTDPRNPDSDGDGLADLQERLLGTNALVADSDGDGLNDGWEVSQGLQPLFDDADFDNDLDGLSNREEFMHGTFANRFDSDQDGVHDGDEIANGRNPLGADLVELHIEPSPNGGLQITWPSQSGQHFSLYGCQDVCAEGFHLLETTIPATPPKNMLPISSINARMFRIEME